MKKCLKFMAMLIFATTLIITQTGCGGEEKVEKTSYYMDTICTITVYHESFGMSEEDAYKAIDSAFALCADYESLISATREESDIYKINAAGGEPVTCNKDTVELLKMGMKYGDLSGGRFDITLGPVTDLWDFHAEEPKVPSESDVAEALKAVDYQQIQIDGNKVSMKDPKGKINLGGIGKGYIADLAANHLVEMGAYNAIVNFGGNIVVVGDKNGEDFKIGIKDPNQADGDVLGAVSVSDATVVTSGVYERCFEQDDTIYHHILDVETGFPVDSDVMSVTLVAPVDHSADCDAMSTICLILGVDKGMKFIEEIDGVEAIFVDTQGKIFETSGMDCFETI